MQIIIDGKPWPQMRSRHTKTGRAYKAPAQISAESITIFKMVAAKNGAEVIIGPVLLRVEFLFPRPESHFGTGKNKDILKASAPIHHVFKPDTDNLIKHVKDCATRAGIWADDCQVINVIASKQWCNSQPGATMIEITEVEP